jgi:hypothetical protein
LQFRDYLAAHGYDVSQMGLRDEDSVASAESASDVEKEKATV